MLIRTFAMLFGFYLLACAASGFAQAPASDADTSAVRAFLQQLTRATDAGDMQWVLARIDPSFIGYQRLAEGMRQEAVLLRQVRLIFLEPQIVTGPDVAAVQVAWEKRFYTANDYRPGLVAGNALLLLHREPDGWKLAAVAGDNPLTTASQPAARERTRRP